ncbi:TMEM165/GDT1 family protein [Luteimonas sp. R10]|uniref:TMEM165/GDT1 family protein n=1 Tax=Luteimonas sp. R10 TaxID=3108176 RepID=UPI00308C0A47|nr:TMEM165/GDT1 family protein [Luteimonas sp. R10]
MDALFVSTFAVAVAEIGDKTQLLALLLAARYRKPWPIVAGILLATLLNHALAAWFGAALSEWLPADALRWLVAGSFVAVAAWTLRPDRLEEDERRRAGPGGAFLATLVAFFLAEIGDKTQVATVLLAAKYEAEALAQVIAGTTLGMLIANLPVVLLGARFADRLPLRAARIAAALLFLVLAVWVAWRGVG